MRKRVTVDDRYNHPHPFINELLGLQVYETNFVRRGRKSKVCTACGADIAIGSPAFDIKFYGWECDFPSNVVCEECYNGAEGHEKEHALIQEVVTGKWDIDD